MNFNLTNGYTVRTTSLFGATEFETRNTEGETVSTVVLKGAESADMLTNLRVLSALTK